jgi:GT2 family glycosyltransferase
MDALSSLATIGAPARPRRRTGPRLSVVVVNYHDWADTARLVQQLRASPLMRHDEAEVVVVDNRSPWHPIVPRLRRWPGVSLRRWRRNRGFARAVNEGCRLSQGDWLLLLNPDMDLPANFLEEVLRRADALAAAEPSAGIVGFGLRDHDGSRQLSAGRFPTLLGCLAGLALPRWRRKYVETPTNRPTPVDWVTGCCLLVRRDCWDDVGGLSPDFFLYYEDVDLCRRAAERGWTVWHEPGPWAVHHSPLHARAVPPHLRVITRHALLTYARKHWPGWQVRALAGIVRLEAWLRGLWARGRSEPAARHFAELGRIATDLAAGREDEAGRRLRRVVQDEEERRARAVDRGAQPQPARPAAPVPGQRGPARPGLHGGDRRR